MSLNDMLNDENFAVQRYGLWQKETWNGKGTGSAWNGWRSELVEKSTRKNGCLK